jgi:SOS response regulatory protein OraA/RecX
VGRGYGDDWIRHDLSRHGVDAETAAGAIATLEPEAARAARIVARRPDERKAAALLARKGFGDDAVQTALGSRWRDEPPEL